MKKMFCILSLAIASSASCIYVEGGNGNQVTQVRSVEGFDAISSAGSFDVELVDGVEGELILEGESNLLEHLKTEVKDGELFLETEAGALLRPSRDIGIRILVSVESLSALSLSGSGDVIGRKIIASDNFNTSNSGTGNITVAVESQTVDASISGSGDMLLGGRTDDFDASISGSGNIRAFSLETDRADISISGSGDVEVSASESLKARISGSGNITYRGTPELDSAVSGSGEIARE